jgi:TPR repeat protein
MRYEAAWNLVGVPDDAKDAVQIAAREAGLSVGEWLTRNILTSLEDIKIPDDKRPRGHLSTQLAELSSRLREFEEQSDSEPMRDAVKKLHEGLSRLAAEFVQTTGQSAIQMSTLASKLETVAERIEEARAEYAGTSEAVEFRLTQIADQVTAQKSTLGDEVQGLAVKLDEVRTETSGKLVGVEHSVAELVARSANETSFVSRELERLTTKLDDVQQMASDASSGLAKQLFELTNRSAAQISTIADTLERTVGRIDNTRTEVSLLSRTLEDRISLFTDKAALQETSFATRFEALTESVECVRGEAKADTKAVDLRIGQIVEQSAGQVSELAGKLEDLNAGLCAVRSEASNVGRQLEQRLAQAADVAVKHRAELAEKLGRLTGTLNDVRAETSGKLISLEQIVAHTADRTAVLDTALSAKIKDVEARLDTLQSGVQVASRAFDRRLIDIAALSERQRGLLTSKLELLAGNVDDVRAETSKTCAAIEHRLQQLQHNQDIQSGHVAEQARVFADRLDGVDHKIDVVTADALKSLAGEIGLLQDRNGQIQVELQNQSGLFEHKLNQSHEQVAGRLSEIKAVIEALEVRLTLSTEKAAAMKSEVADDIALLSGHVAAALYQTSGMVAVLEQRLKTSSEQSTSRQSEMANEIARLSSDAAATRHEIAEAVGAAEQRLSQLFNKSGERTVELVGIVASLGEKIETLQKETSQSSAAFENQISQRVGEYGAQISALTNRVQSLSDAFAGSAVGDSRAASELAERLTTLQASVDRLDAGDDAASMNMSERLETLRKGLGDAAAKTAELSGIVEDLRKPAANPSEQVLLELSAKLDALASNVESTQLGAARMAESVEQQLATMEQGLKRLGEQQAETTSTSAKANEQDTTAISTLEGAIAILEKRLSERSLDDRVISIEHTLAELASGARVTEPAQAARPAPNEPPPFAEAPIHTAPVEERAAQGDTTPVHETVELDHSAEADLPPPTPPVARESEGALDSAAFETVSQAFDVIAPKNTRKSPPSYLSAAREAANAADRAKAEIVASGVFDTRLGTIVPADGRRLGKLSAGLAAGVALVAASAVGVGMYLSLSSHHEVTLNGRASSGTGAKQAHLQHAVSAVASAARERGAQRDSVNWKHVADQAKTGDAHAALLLGLHALSDKSDSQSAQDAVKWLQFAADHGNAIAQFRLGAIFATGRGVPADPVKAFALYKSSAAQGNRLAMYNLAVAYVQGSGTTTSLSEAVRWFSDAAKLGLIDAQFDLAVLYERGTGVPQSLVDAYRWYAIAAKAGDKESMVRVDALNTQLSGDERAAAQTAADQFRVTAMDERANVLAP